MEYALWTQGIRKKSNLKREDMSFKQIMDSESGSRLGVKCQE